AVAGGPAGGAPARRGGRGRAGQRRVAEQRPGHGEGTRRGGVVGRVGRAEDQRLVLGGRVVEAALAVAERAQRHLEQLAGQVQPARLAGHAGQGEESLGHAGIVVQCPGGATGGPVARGADEAPVGQVHAGQQGGRVARGRGEVRAGEQQAAFGQRGYCQPV